MKTLLQDYVTERAERGPDAAAVVSDETTMTYGELEARSNQLAHLLREAGCRKGDRICLLAPKSGDHPWANARTLQIDSKHMQAPAFHRFQQFRFRF